MCKRSHHPAFVDREMPVVIAILFILVAILVPVFLQARTKARQVNCLSNEHQIGLALQMYMQDYNETQPRRQNDVALTSWRHDIRPYLMSVKTDSQVFVCPSNPNSHLLSRDNPETAHDDPTIHVSYSLNNNDANGVGGACNRQAGAGSLARIASPAQVIGIVESTAYASDFVVTAQVTGESGAFHAIDATARKGHLYSGHSGRSNFWFMDGHGKSLKPLDTMNSVDPGNTKSPGSTRNLWTINNSNFTDQDPTHSPGANPFTSAHENLSYSQSVDQ